MTAGFVRASTTLDLERAFEGMALSVTGLLALGLAPVSILLRLRRRLGLRLAAALRTWSGAVADEPSRAAVRSGGGGLVVVPGFHRYHRPACTMVAGLATSSLTPADGPTGLQPCGICGAPEGRAAAVSVS
jgi:hypothetical protein